MILYGDLNNGPAYLIEGSMILHSLANLQPRT